MLIEVTETHPPKAGKKVGTVVAAGGAKFEVWPEKLAGIHVGRRYEVDVEDREYNGRAIRKITKATPVNGAANGKAPASTATAAAGEPECVARVLAALITSGQVAGDKQSLWTATQMLRQLWTHTFGGSAS